VHLEVALEVEDGHLLGLGGAEKLAKRGIGVDVLLVVELLVLHVGHDATGDIRAAHLRALGLTEEDAEVIGNLLGLGEDGLLLGKGVARLIKGRGPSAAAATGLLELTPKALLSLLHVGKHKAERGAKLVHLRDVSGELGNKVHLLLAGSGNGGGGRCHHRGGNGGGRSGGCRGGLAARRGGNSRLRLNGSGNSNRGGGLLGGSSLGGLRTHFILITGLVSWVF